jgi:hypothetical protein
MDWRPEQPPLARRFFFLFVVVYLYAFPYFEQLRSANELPRVLVTQEIVDRGVFYLDHRMRELGSTFDIARGPGGHMYPNKAPGPSLLAIPAYLVCKALGFTSVRACTWAFRVSAVTLPALLFLPFFYRLTRRFAPQEPARRTALGAYALGSAALPYGILFFSHQIAAACVGAAFIAAVALVRREARRPEDAAAATGFFAATAVLMDYHAAIAAAFLGLYVLWKARRPIKSGFLVAVGAAPPATVLGMYHWLCFGSPLKTGYSFYGLTQAGFLGAVGPSRHSANIVLFLPSNGIVVLMPWVLIAVLGALAIATDPEARARVGAEALVATLVVAAYVVFVSSLTPELARAGWCVGPRYLVVCLPFVGWLAAAGFAAADRHWFTSLLAQALVVASCIVYLAVITTYPHWPDGLQNPLYELAFPLLHRGYAVPSLGRALGLRGIWAAVPLYVFAAGLLLWLLARGRRRSWPVAVLACLLGAGLVGAHRAFPLTGSYATRAWTFVTATWDRPPPR